MSENLRADLIAQCRTHNQRAAVRGLLSVASDRDLQRWEDPELWTELGERWTHANPHRSSMTGTYYATRARSALGQTRNKQQPRPRVRTVDVSRIVDDLEREEQSLRMCLATAKDRVVKIEVDLARVVAIRTAVEQAAGTEAPNV